MMGYWVQCSKCGNWFLQYTTQTSLEQICANCFLDQVHIPDSSGTLE